ncbi:hypothetical protein RJI07_06245 [Mycoplasmatota bacterium WC30]
MPTENKDLIKKLKQDIKEKTEKQQSKNDGFVCGPDDLINIYSGISELVKIIENQSEEIDEFRKLLNLNSEQETQLNQYQLDLLDFVFTNGSINQKELDEFFKKDSKYRIAFTQLKDTYIYKGYGGIYSSALKYHIKPEKEKYIAEALSKVKPK